LFENSFTLEIQCGSGVTGGKGVQESEMEQALGGSSTARVHGKKVMRVRCWLGWGFRGLALQKGVVN
jgi:hypothetical protein